MEIRTRNVIGALSKGVAAMLQYGVPRDSRVGPVLEIPEPVFTHYLRPRERVLISVARDANPYLHFFESLWMLAGRDDLKFLEHFTKNFSKYSDDGVRMQGSYGHRWRKAFDVDQIDFVIKLLTEDPDSRRGVISMWDPRYDLTHIESSDIPCNTTAYIKIRPDVGNFPTVNLTVCNRSNDMIWGAYGANAVHMSMLLEYIAASLPHKIHHVTMTQMSDSLHVYTSGPGGEVWDRIREVSVAEDLVANPYWLNSKEYPVVAMFRGTTRQIFDEDLARFFQLYDRGQSIAHDEFQTYFFQTIVTPMWLSHKRKSYEIADSIGAEDWRKACTEWLARRGHAAGRLSKS